MKGILKGAFLLVLFFVVVFPPEYGTFAQETDLLATKATIKVVTLSVLEKHLVENIGSDQVSVTSILGPSENPFGYSPSAAEITAVAEADILFAADLFYLLTQSYTFVWLPGLLNASGNTDLIQVDLSRNVTVGIDPVMNQPNFHTWTDPRNIHIMVEDIADELTKLDGGNENLYAANLDAYQSQIDQLVTAITAKAAPYNGTKVVTVSSQAWYLLDLIGFEKVGQLVLTSAAQVTAADIENIISIIEEQGIKILVNDYAGPKPDGVNTIIEDTGVKEIVFESDVGAGKTYLEMIEGNVESLVEAVEESEETDDNGIPGFDWNLTIIGIFFYSLIALFYTKKRITKA
ncbi:MAG: metal ABC transporter substrate-binding protein [Candidatus Hodarchaeota archaeon]